jgi:diguanylate cyclase
MQLSGAKRLTKSEIFLTIRTNATAFCRQIKRGAATLPRGGLCSGIRIPKRFFFAPQRHMAIKFLLSHISLAMLVGISSIIAGAMLRRWLTQTNLRRYFRQRRLARLLSRVQHVSAGVAAHVDLHDREVVAVGDKLSHGRQERANWPQQLTQYVGELIDANEQVQTKLQIAEDQLDKLMQQIRNQANEARTDVLTGLANRRAFDERAQKYDTAACQDHLQLSAVMVDIDHFKHVNDLHGHDVGDQVLLETAHLLRTQLRNCDMVYRYGGEEFAVLLPEIDVTAAGQLADRLRVAISQHELTVNDRKLSITISLGVAQKQTHEDLPGLIKRADQALYAAKRAGRNRAYWHNGDMPHPVRAAHNSTANATPQALPVGELD